MSSRLRRWGLAALLILATPSASFAQEEEVSKEARTEGYQSSIVLQDAGNALTYLLFLLLFMLAGGVMFMNAKRTHLD